MTVIRRKAFIFFILINLAHFSMYKKGTKQIKVIQNLYKNYTPGY
jgi:hypothetical protein